MLAISVDVENELGEIAAEVRHLDIAVLKLRTARPVHGSQEAWESAHVCASATEKVYTVLERIMAWIVAEVDQAPIGHTDGWHRHSFNGSPMPSRTVEGL